MKRALVVVALAAGLIYLVMNRIPQPGQSFDLVASNGRTVTEQTYRGQWQLIYFGYSFCPDACPLSLNTVTEALAALGPLGEKLQPIFITIDPERDTPEALAAFVANFSPKIVALTGSRHAIDSAEKAFGVSAVRVQAEDGSNNYFMDHSSLFYLIDPRGRSAAILSVPADGTVLADRLRAYLLSKS